MRKIVSKTVLWILFISCTSAKAPTLYKPLTETEVQNFTVLGVVQTNFKANNEARSSTVSMTIMEQAYMRLLNEASRQYQGNVDVRDITAVHISGNNDSAEWMAKGNVVVLTSGGRIVNTTATGVEGALARAADETLKNVPQRSRIAIVYITAQDRSTTDYISGELEYIWVNNGYIITDRSQLDRLRREQDFQLSGEIDDATAVSIGKFAGADIIVTGRVDGEGNLQRLRLRALDTQTAQVVGVASERL